MKLYYCLEKRFVHYFSSIVVCFCITVVCAACQKPSPQATADRTYPIYLVARESSTAQIWQVSPDGNSSSLVYEITKSVNRPVATVFPPEEIEKLQSYLALQSLPITTTESALLPEPYIEWLTLSPMGDAVAWVEGDVYRDGNSAVWFGVQRVITLDLNTRDPNVLLQMPSHADEFNRFHISGDPAWSSDGQHVAVIRGFTGGAVEASLIVVNISTGQTRKTTVTVDSSGPLIWSPDNTTIAWPLSRWHTRSSGGAVRFFTLYTEECKDIELEGLWVWGWSMDWSPDGKRIVFAAKQENSDVFSDDAKLGLHLLDPSTGLVQDVPVDIDGVLENPRWSPDGQLLAVDYRPKVGDFFQSLLVIEPNSGQIVSQLSVPRAVSSWVWGRDGHSILVLTGIGSVLYTGRAGLEVKIFDVRDGSLQTVELPDNLATKQINSLNW
jgi:Tol biopolymer transport system component